MASVIDTIRTVIGSRYSIIKIAVIALLFAYPLNQFIMNFSAGWCSTWAYIAYGVGVFFLGYLLLASHYLINEDNEILPGFLNPFKILLVGIGGILAIGPMVAVMVYVGICLYTIFFNKGFSLPINIAAVSVVELILLGLLTLQMTLYAKSFNPLAAYNPIKILKGFLDFALKAIPLLIMLAIFSAIVLYPLGYLTYLMFGAEGLPLLIFISFSFTFIMLVLVLYYSQFAMENMMIEEKMKDDESAGDMMDKSLLVDRDRKY